MSVTQLMGKNVINGTYDIKREMIDDDVTWNEWGYVPRCIFVLYNADSTTLLISITVVCQLVATVHQHTGR